MNHPQAESQSQTIHVERRLSPELFVQNAGWQRCVPGWSWGPGVRDHYVLYHVLSGHGSFRCGGGIWELGPGSSFLVFPGMAVSCATLGREPWSCIWVGFSGSNAGECVRVTGLRPEHPVLDANCGHTVRNHTQEILETCGQEPGDCLTMTGGLYRLLGALAHRVGNPPQGQHPPDCVELAVAYIAEHYQQNITIGQLAALSSVSHSSLYRGFMSRFGISPKHYLMEYRVEKAKWLLTDTALPVSEISSAVGFEDPLYFSRVFRQLTGQPPRQYGRGGKK